MPTEPLALVPSDERSSGLPAPPTTDEKSGIAVESSPSRKNGQALVKRRPARVKPPKDSRVRKAALAVIALRAQGVKMKEISEQLGYTPDTLRQYISIANKRGWLNLSSFPDPDDQLEYVLKNKVVRNVNEFLDERDKDVTLEAAKGLGMFKTHQVVKGDTTAQIGMALRVQVEMPPAQGQPAVTIRPGTIGGARGLDIPVDAEVLEE